MVALSTYENWFYNCEELWPIDHEKLFRLFCGLMPVEFSFESDQCKRDENFVTVSEFFGWLICFTNIIFYKPI